MVAPKDIYKKIISFAQIKDLYQNGGKINKYLAKF